MAGGVTDLDQMLATLAVDRRPGVFTFVSGPAVLDDVEVQAMIVEREGVTSVVAVEDARGLGLDVDFEAAWLTLRVHSALEAVGLTAAFSAALGEREIPCNVLAGTFHDHLLVPVDRVDDAVDALEALRERAVEDQLRSE